MEPALGFLMGSREFRIGRNEGGLSSFGKDTSFLDPSPPLRRGGEGKFFGTWFLGLRARRATAQAIKCRAFGPHGKSASAFGPEGKFPSVLWPNYWISIVLRGTGDPIEIPGRRVILPLAAFTVKQRE